jgi:putative SOS response-associated peptidase YedK
MYANYEGLVIVPGSRLLARYRWGFFNPFDPKRPLVNARDDKVAKSQVFKKAFTTTRCLVPVSRPNET